VPQGAQLTTAEPGCSCFNWVNDPRCGIAGALDSCSNLYGALGCAGQRTFVDPSAGGVSIGHTRPANRRLNGSSPRRPDAPVTKPAFARSAASLSTGRSVLAIFNVTCEARAISRA
jgi:hypothetical protein